MSPRHRLVLVAVLLAAASILTHARQQPPTREPGLYLVKADGSAVRLTLQAPDIKTKGMGKSIISQGIMRPSTEGHVSGAHADEHIAPGVATFYLHLPSAAKDPMAMAMNNMAMPPQVKNPGNVALIRLKVADTGDERIADLGKAGGGKPKNIVDWTPTKLSATVFTFETKAPLDAGEYAVTTVPVLNGELWDFGVR
jgi:hypothetical protein